MSCEAGFTDSHCNEQTTDNPRAEAGATHKTAFRELENDIETANAILKAAIEDAVEGLDCAFSLFEDCEQDPKNADRISISMRSLEVLKRRAGRCGGGDRICLQGPRLGGSPGAARRQTSACPRDGTLMGKRSLFPRIRQDAYPTPAEAVAPLLPHLAPKTRFIEPCCGDGHLVGHLKRAGHMLVGAYDLPDDARVKRYDGLENGAVFITNSPWRRDRPAPDHRQSLRPGADLAVDRRRLGPHAAVGAVPAAPPHHRQRRPSEVDQGFAVHRQGRLRLASL